MQTGKPGHRGGTELAVASPGIDEVSLIADLITAINGQVTLLSGLRQQRIADFYVGIVRLSGGSFGDKGLERVLALIRHPAVLAACKHAKASSLLAVAVTAGFFEELQAEGLPHRDWQPVRPLTPGSACPMPRLLWHPDRTADTQVP